uniref:Circularly permutated Ras protein 1-like n=1 Tax=Kryptolebias marmoratus TaxID=37003 RepID=A0A3Q2ZK49_KRYMA
HRKPRPSSLPLELLPSARPPLAPLSLPPPPPVPPRRESHSVISLQALGKETNFNVNVVSLGVAKLVDISRGQTCFHSVLPQFRFPLQQVWVCEFCGSDNSVNGGVASACVGQRAGVRSDDLYLPPTSDDDYQNLENTLVIFCVDISGSMSVTTEVRPKNAEVVYGGSSAHISRLEGIQDALQRALASMLQQAPHRRVALVTFNDEVVIYGDGTGSPLSLREWALLDYDHIWQQAASYGVPHCVAETYGQLVQRVKEEHGATALGPAALASVAMASRYPGSKVILCTDGRANIGLGDLEQSPPLSSLVIISIMSFKGTDCRLADIGRLADATGGRVNIVSIGTVATEIQSVSVDNVLATSLTLTLMAPEGVYFPFEDENNHKLVREIGNVTKGLEITFEFAVKPDFREGKSSLPFQLQLSFKTRDQQRVTRIITERRPVTTSRLNTAVLGVHCAQLCASLTMEGRVREARKQLKAKLRPIQKDESIYGNWMEAMTTICDDISTEPQDRNDPSTLISRLVFLQILPDEAAEVVYHMRRASSNGYAQVQKNKPTKKDFGEAT